LFQYFGGGVIILELNHWNACFLFLYFRIKRGSLDAQTSAAPHYPPMRQPVLSSTVMIMLA
jgi:hypothetical protein